MNRWEKDQGGGQLLVPGGSFWPPAHSQGCRELRGLFICASPCQTSLTQGHSQPQQCRLVLIYHRLPKKGVCETRLPIEPWKNGKLPKLTVCKRKARWMKSIQKEKWVTSRVHTEGYILN